jgi:hypothetical protein
MLSPELANDFMQTQIERDRLVAAKSLENVRALKKRERKALVAAKPKRQYSAKLGHYDPTSQWIFKRTDGQTVIDEPLRDYYAQLARIDQALN